MLVRSFASALVLATSLLACAAAPRPAFAGQPALPLAGLELDETRGSVVVLAFFTTWCPASRQALRAIEELRARNAAKSDLAVVAVGEGNSAEEVSTFAASLGVRARIAFDKDGAVATHLALPTIPAILVLARDGSIRHVHAGYHGEEDRDAIAREVTALLEAGTTR